jgi:hypothetical protein
MPATAEALTGAGGRHFLFRVDPEVKVANEDGLMPGLDLKGEGGMLVVEPSLPPKTRREYVWVRPPQQGIARAPRWLMDRPPRVKRAVPAGADRPPRCVRPGGEAVLLERIIARSPVPGPGHRNDLMYRAVGSLLGQEYEPDQVRRVVMEWVHHSHQLGLIATDPERVERDVEACIRSTMRNPNFGRATSGLDHRARLAEVELTPTQRRRIEYGAIREGRIVAGPGPGTAPLPSNRVTLGVARLCRTAQERAFVMALTVYMTYKAGYLGEEPPKGTLGQLGQLIEDRHGLRLAKPQLERLMRKYVTRPDKPASRLELAIQTVKGKPGVPSEYKLTGLLELIAAPDDRANAG